MSERLPLEEMADHLSAAAVEATEPVERGWLELCERYDMAGWSGVEPWEPPSTPTPRGEHEPI